MFALSVTLMCVFCFWVSFVNTSYLIPQREQEREEKLFVLSSVVKSLDRLLTTCRLLGWGVAMGMERKEIYILYINIYVNCIVLLYRHWHCYLSPSSGLIIVQPPQTASLAYLGFSGHGLCVRVDGGPVLALRALSALFWWEECAAP